MTKLINNPAHKQKGNSRSLRSSFGREIGLALIIKFLLLFMLWWLFFAGKKLAVNTETISNKLLDLENPAVISSHPQEKP